MGKNCLKQTVATVTATVCMMAATAAQATDFGAMVEHLLHAQSQKLFGIAKPLERPADAGDVVPRELASADERQLLAKNLKAEFVARNVAYLADMIAFWPDDVNYTHLIICIEQSRAGTTPLGNGGLNAAVQRVNVETGAVETILHGMSRCDGIRTTPWGTVLVTEETDDGRGYEIIDPLNTTGHWVADRATGDVRDGIDSATASSNIVQRQDLPTMAWEGLTVLANGVVIGGDELRPGSDGLGDSDGGAIFRFVPDTLFSCVGPLQTPGAVCQNPIDDLADSPLAAGRTFALQIQCTTGVQFGQGCEVGTGSWIQVNPLMARADTDARGATGYYRPEDLHRDPTFGPADLSDLSAGIRFCWTNTGNEGAMHFAETVCAEDLAPAATQEVEITAGGITNDYLSPDGTERALTYVNRFVEGDERFNSFDNLAFQPATGNLYVIEDHSFGEIYACLPDGADRDIKSDGCVSVLSVIDPGAEPTGFIFDGTGEVAFYNIQHGQQPPALLDFSSNPVDGRTDDLIKITGFKVQGTK
jgi:hypothetical protein